MAKRRFGAFEPDEEEAEPTMNTMAEYMPEPVLGSDDPQPQTRDSTVTVKRLNGDTYDGRWLVIRVDTKEGRLVETQYLRNSMGEQNCSLDVFENSPAPYNWGDEIAALVVTADQIRIALWRTGMIEQQQLDLKALVATTLRSGVLPIKEK